jgi:O-antigen/teichoic acid export membrane protein
VVGAAILALVGVSSAGPYGLVLAFAPFVGVGVALIGRERADFGAPGPSSAWSELTRSLGWLFAGALFAQALINLGPISVRLLAPHDGDLTSAFVATLIVARVPVFLFQAAQAALLPRLSHHAGGGHAEVLAAETAALVRALIVLVGVAAVGAAVLGPTVVRIGWGDGFALRASDFAVLAAASCIYLIALTIAQALLALECPNRASWAWALGVGVLALCVILGGDVLTRVEVGFLTGSVTAAVAMGLLLRRPMASATASASVPNRASGDR